jgi:hypothetical protein
VPFGFIPLQFGVPAQEVSAELPLLDFASVKMSELEDVVGGRLEVEGHILVEEVAEQVLMCFYNRDPHVSLESVVQGLVEEV